MDNDKDIHDNMCFVIMPIGDGAVYEHFKHVYDDIFADAIKNAGFTPKRADDDKSSSMIQVSIIQDIVKAPMAICDLSTRNPNVLFELGIRQAFDLPVVLVQEEGTPKIFDISTINTVEYRKERIYHQVLEDKQKILDALNATKKDTKGINSIIRLLDIEKANIKEKGKISEIDELKFMIQSLTEKISYNQNKIINSPDKISTNSSLDNYFIAGSNINDQYSIYSSLLDALESKVKYVDNLDNERQYKILTEIEILEKTINSYLGLNNKTKAGLIVRIDHLRNQIKNNLINA